jgi:hypothetical protein
MTRKILCAWVIVAFMLGCLTLPVRAQDVAPQPPGHQYQSTARSDQGLSPYGLGGEHDPPGELIIADALVLRPLGVVASVVGLVSASIFAFPWAATSNSYDRVERELIQKPFDYTFCRPLGDVDY